MMDYKGAVPGYDQAGGGPTGVSSSSMYQAAPNDGGRPGGGHSSAPGGSGGGDLFSGAASAFPGGLGAMGAVGGSVLRQQVASGAARLVPGAHTLWRSLRYYFAINNAYVLAKLKLLLFPWRHGNWRREAAADGAAAHEFGSAFQPATRDINAPDMYIPAMSFITLVLVTALIKGSAMEFTPETLGEATTVNIGMLTFEVIVYKFALWMINSAQLSTLDLAAYSGYKFLGMTLSMLAGMLLGSATYYVCLIYTGACMFRVIYNVFAESLKGPSELTMAQKRNTFFIAAGLLQVVLMWWGGQAPAAAEQATYAATAASATTSMTGSM